VDIPRSLEKLGNNKGEANIRLHRTHKRKTNMEN